MGRGRRGCWREVSGEREVGIGDGERNWGEGCRERGGEREVGRGKWGRGM